ncbi:unnamed protein product [Dibothriocephalus latus]|uniref:Small monomeric GTPase n=1 Tax=Dibothriocephalus latus TaxID=60516 RepID=A0A3P7NBD3_DIBLA|nr:unnamed protein product [Dibothriocephalus latus]
MQYACASHSSGAIKCVIIGDGAVGKTCLFLRYITGGFKTQHEPTICDVYAMKVTYQDKPFTLKLFDTAGQEDFEHLRNLCYHEANVFILCFAVDNRDSFENIEKVRP